VEVAVEHHRRRPTGLLGSPLEHGLKGGVLLPTVAPDVDFLITGLGD
jgi:hypothetical protein